MRIRSVSALLVISLLAVSGSQLPAANFIRGDVNQDGLVDVSDPITALGFLFLGDPVSLACSDAADANDDSVVDVSDSVAALTFLFLGDTEIPAPGPESCGPDPTEDALTCASFEPCSGDREFAQVLEVSASGSPGAYTFLVTVESPDTGCDQWADWWEVISPEGQLLHRRVLLHSHTGEQPFTRSGFPVPIDADTEVIVRAHMNTVGYGTQALRGSPAAGFESVELQLGFADELAEQPPLPEGCAF